MLKHILVCLLFITVLGCGTHPYPDFTTWHTDAPDSKNRHFQKVSFSKVLKTPQNYVRGNTGALLEFEAVVKRVTDRSVILETNNELIAFVISEYRPIDIYGGGPLQKGEVANVHPHHKYSFRCWINGMRLNLIPGGGKTRMIIYAYFILTSDYMQMLYPPILVE
ncbi:MAG: hypothetical protein OXI43_10055 [Candidatus Poribacteria bacterium]|nr:hypothetical protein [Candidatus Poribacteria bacterium]